MQITLTTRVVAYDVTIPVAPSKTKEQRQDVSFQIFQQCHLYLLFADFRIVVISFCHFDDRFDSHCFSYDFARCNVVRALLETFHLYVLTILYL